MKGIRIISFVLLGLLLAFFLVGAFVKSVKYDFTMDIQAPTYKAFAALASHEFKSIQYPNIDPLTAKVEPFEVGNTTYLDYQVKGKKRFVREEVIQMDSLKLVVLKSESKSNTSQTELHFENRNLITRVHYKEEIFGNSILERAMLIILKSPIATNRERLFRSLKTRIESTPDFDYRPEERK